MRQRGSRWLKLLFDQHERLLSVAVISLAPPGRRAGEAAGGGLRWPGLVPGNAALRRYPDAANWRPFIWSMGARQWLWLEESHDPSDPAGRSRFLGGLVVNDASGFAAGAGFPYDLAHALTAGQPALAGWGDRDLARPLLDWRLRTPPNVYVESRVQDEDPGPGCGAETLTFPVYTDFPF